MLPVVELVEMRCLDVPDDDGFDVCASEQVCVRLAGPGIFRVEING
jgi:hypothetical protein